MRHPRRQIHGDLRGVNILNQIPELCGVGKTKDDKIGARISTMTWSAAADLLGNRKASADLDVLFALERLFPVEFCPQPRNGAVPHSNHGKSIHICHI